MASPSPLSSVVAAQEREEREWKTMSAKWRESLSKLVSTLDTVNKNRSELERQKALIRHALTTGKFDQIERERALALYGEWNRGIQMIPLYPEDYAPRRVRLVSPVAAMDDAQQEDVGESVYLTPLSGADAPEPVSRYVYELDDGLFAQPPKRQWIRVAPPQLVAPSTMIVAPGPNGPIRPTTVTLPPPPLPLSTPSSYEAIAGWRVLSRPMPPRSVPMAIVASPFRPPKGLPMVPEWRARQQQAAIASQYQRVYYPQDIAIESLAPFS